LPLSRTLAGLSALAALLAAAPAAATCRVEVRPVAFGTIDLGRKSYGKGEILVRCERPTRFEVAILGGAERELVAPSGARLRYRLFADPGHRRPWGDGGRSGATVTAESDGKRPVRLTVYGLIPRQSGRAEGHYVDQLAVVLRY
jgi:spore coat protein U-like protein